MYLLQAAFWDQNIMDLIKGIKDVLPDQQLIGVARQIGAILALLYLSYKAYAMIVGEGRLEVLPLFRPFIIAMVIINFSTLTTILDLPAKGSETYVEPKFRRSIDDVEKAMMTKSELYDKLWTKLLENVNEMKLAYGGSDTENGTILEKGANMVTGGAYDKLSNIGAYFVVFEKMLWVKVTLVFQSFVMWIVTGVFKGMMYCIFFIQLLLLYILQCLGPISIAFSVSGPFKDSWAHWIARYIAVSFYSTIAFIALNISFAILYYGITQENDRIQNLIDSKYSIEQFVAMITHVDSFIGYLLIALVTCVAGILSIPVISTWIISTTGAGGVVFNTVTKAVSTAATMPAKAAGSLSKAVN